MFPGLIASLAFNLLFVGGLAAAAWHHHIHGPKGSEPGLIGFIRELPADRQDVVRQEMAAANDAIKDLRATVRQQWLDANGLLTAEPFDKAKYKAALDQLAESESKFKAALNNTLAETANTLSADERKLLQAWREKRRPGLLMRPPEQPADDAKSN